MLSARLKPAGTISSVSSVDRIRPPITTTPIGARHAPSPDSDKAVGTIVAASDSDGLRIVDREEVRETRRKLFGFALPDLGIFGRRDGEGHDAREDELEVLQTTITSVRGTGDGYILTTAEGAKWQIDSVPRRLLTPKAGQSLEIRNAALSAYFLRINGQGGVKGRRIE